MTKVVQDFLWAQKVQDPIALFSDWLYVGHVDEFMTFVPAPDRKVMFPLKNHLENSWIENVLCKHYDSLSSKADSMIFVCLHTGFPAVAGKPRCSLQAIQKIAEQWPWRSEAIWG